MLHLFSDGTFTWLEALLSTMLSCGLKPLSVRYLYSFSFAYKSSLYFLTLSFKLGLCFSHIHIWRVPLTDGIENSPVIYMHTVTFKFVAPNEVEK